jgi:hypothetical protein
MSTETALRSHYSVGTERDMATPVRSHAEVILNMWAAGTRQGEIAAAIPCDVEMINSVLQHARKDGDRRAIRRQLFHKNFGSIDTREGISHAQSNVLRRTRLGKRFPATREELVQIAAASGVKVTILPPGYARW